MAKNKVEERGKQLEYIDINMLYPHPDNPRKDIGDISELAESIKTKGIMQNLTVVPWFSEITHQPAENNKMDGKYRVVIGHRRLEAAKQAGLTRVPCVIVDMTYEEQVATMLLENIQRADLTVYEQACGFQMMLELGNDIATVAEKTGFSQSTVRRRVKLLELNQEEFKKASDKQITLSEFDKLNQIEDVDKRNEVLKSIGTNNYNYSVENALRVQRCNKLKENCRKHLNDSGLKEVSSEEYSKKHYMYVSSFNLEEKDISKITVSEKAQIFYFPGYGAFVNLLCEPKEEEKITQSEEDKAEEEKWCRKEVELIEATKRAYECRKKFVKDGCSLTILKKHLNDIICFIIRMQWSPERYGYGDNCAKFADIVNVTFEEGKPKAYELVSDVTENFPEVALLAYAYTKSGDNDSFSYRNYNSTFKENKLLNTIYSFLEKLGYELSDEEKELRDGTSKLFFTEAELTERYGPDDDEDDDFEEDNEDFDDYTE